MLAIVRVILCYDLVPDVQTLQILVQIMQISSLLKVWPGMECVNSVEKLILISEG